jgi:hypothetical protein
MKRTKHQIENYLDLIRQIAWSFHKTTKIEYEELFSEGCLAFCESSRYFKPGKSEASFCTYIRACITRALIDFSYMYKEATHADPPAFIEVSENPIYEYYEDFSGDVKELVGLTMEVENGLERTPKLARGKLRDQLRSMGWTCSRVWDSFRETKKLLTETEIGSILIV